MRRHALFAAAATLLWSLVVLAGPAAPAHACSCVASDPYVTADFIVEGTVTDVRPLADAPDRVRATVAVDRTLKGEPRRSATVGSARVNAPDFCAHALEPGVRYRIFGYVDARQPDIDGWSGGSCFGAIELIDPGAAGTRGGGCAARG
jgi:hypothetical protein